MDRPKPIHVETTESPVVTSKTKQMGITHHQKSKAMFRWENYRGVRNMIFETMTNTPHTIFFAGWIFDTGWIQVTVSCPVLFSAARKSSICLPS